MRVLFTTLRVPSHFLPLVPFIAACRARGHEVAVAAPAELEERTRKTGAAFHPFAHPGDAGLEPLWARMRAAPDDAERSRIVIGEIFAGACAGAAIPDLQATVDRLRPEVIVREAQEYAALVVAEEAGIPHVRVAIMAPALDADLLPTAARAVDVHRVRLGVPADPSGERAAREPVFTQFPAALDAPYPGSERVRRFRAPRGEAKPLPAWWGERQGPLVYLTLGTVAGSMEVARSAYRVALSAVRELPARVLLTIGADLGLDVLGEVPANVHVERFVPQDEVLPHASAVVCHGGSGTVLGALAAGVPLVVTPLFADQPGNAERVAAACAGVALPTQGVTAGALRAAIDRVLRDGAFHRGARRVADEIRALPAADEAPAELERMAREVGSRPT